jgi:hypothetical protein
MITPDSMAATAQALLKRAELSPQEVARRLKLALDVDYWRDLIPSAAIEGHAPEGALVRIAAKDATREARRIADEGYFHLGNALSSGWVDRTYRAVEAVRTAGWPAVFAFVFDDCWSIANSGPLLDFLGSSLGDGCRQNTVVWAHWVPDATGSAGWRPHIDSKGQGDRFLSIWIALSDATVDNGCMFLVRPRAVTPEIAQAIDARMDLPYASYRHLLHNVVALPATAGSIIGWRGDVLHWGGLNTGGAAPRASLALEFRSHDSTASQFEAPLIDPREGPPPFRLRLFAVAKALREYSKFEPMISRFQVLAQRLWEDTAPPP